MQTPSFLIVGAAKSGTTSLYYYLKEHPDIFMPISKEPAFFAYAGSRVNFQGPGDHRRNATVITDPQIYQQLFQEAHPNQQTGEASVVYLYHPEAPHRIKAYNPDMKLIAVLRDPVERAVSNYTFLRKDGYEECATLKEALQLEEERIAANWQYIWHYSRLGFYYQQLRRYYDLFPKEQILVLKQEDLKNDTANVLQRVLEFLDVDADYPIDTSYQYNRSGKMRHVWLHRLFIEPHKFKTIYRQVLPYKTRHYIRRRIFDWNVKTVSVQIEPETLEYLRHLYHEDVLQLQDLVQIDFSKWLQENESAVKTG